jgi:uncharacterized protein (TIGR03083 family)
MSTSPVFAPAPRLGHERYCAEIITQTRLLRETLVGADLTAQVPTCPDWSLRELAVHVGGAHRWAHALVRTRTTEELPQEDVPGFEGPDDEEPAALDAWLAEGADLLAEELREAGPTARVWTWTPQQQAGFWARRMTHETVIHRADAHATVPGAAYEVAPDLAADCLDEWLDVVTLAASSEDEDLRGLRHRAGDTLHLHATDGPEVLGATDAEWLVELTPDGLVWSHAHAKATVALRGPLTDVLRVFYRRLPPDTSSVEVLGDAEFLHLWLGRASWD